MNVEVRITDLSKGKGLYAKSNIAKGSLIFEENPFVSCQFSWNAAYGYLACDHCLRPLETAQQNAARLAGHEVVLPYPECSPTDLSKITSCPNCSVQYCSEECKLIAFEQYHSILCQQSHEKDNSHPLEQLNETWKQIHYPPETSSVMLIVRLLARILKAPNKDEVTAQILQFCHRTVNEDADIAHKLLRDKFVDQLSCLHSRVVAAIPHEGIEQFLTYEGFLSLLALIGTNGQGVGSTAFGTWANNAKNLPLSEKDKKELETFMETLYETMDENVGPFLDNEGIALYTLQSTCNHSCSPNAECQFLNNNHKLSLVAIQDIKEGDEICISYLDECMLRRSRHSRREELMSNYLFICHCSRCELGSDESEVSDDDDNEDADCMSE